MALGSLIIKERLGISDRETVEQIRENPYLQYFIGLTAYSNEAPFEASMLVHFRARINGDLVNKVNKRMVSKIEEGSGGQAEEKKPEEEEIKEPLPLNYLYRDGLIKRSRPYLMSPKVLLGNGKPSLKTEV